jgi:hypothetical protein
VNDTLYEISPGRPGFRPPFLPVDEMTMVTKVRALEDA